MKKRLLSVALGIILLTGVGTSTSVLVTSSAATRQGDASIYKFKEGGIQFTVPAGWEVKPDKEGAVKVSPKTGGNAQIAFVALPIATDLNSDERASLFDTLVEKIKSASLQLGDYRDNETLGGMRLALRPYEGKNNGHDVQGMFFLLSADKFIFIVLAADKSGGPALSNDVEAVINSVKKIE
jgi:hypothetical protein